MGRPPSLLVTGCASRLARRLVAAVLRDGLFEGVVGLDYVLPDPPIPGLAAHRFDILDAGLAAFLREEGISAIAHLLWIQEPLDPALAARVNIGGARRLAHAARKAGVRQVVFRSSTSVYGAGPTLPLFVPEEAAPASEPRDRRAEHLLDAETRLRSLEEARRGSGAGGAHAEGPRLSVLRLAPLIGAGTESRLAAYLRPPLVPTALGFDPRIQVLHEEDAVAALAHALATGHRGTVNVAAPGVLPLHRVLRLLGKSALPLPGPLLAAALALHARRVGRPHLRMDADALRYPAIADTARMERDLLFRPRWDALDAVRSEAARAVTGGGAGDARSTQAPATAEDPAGDAGSLAGSERDLAVERERVYAAARHTAGGDDHGG